MRYEVTVNRDSIDRKLGRPIRVTDTRTGLFEDYDAVEITGTARVVHGAPRSNGATVWVECDQFVPCSP